MNYIEHKELAHSLRKQAMESLDKYKQTDKPKYYKEYESLTKQSDKHFGIYKASLARKEQK